MSALANLKLIAAKRPAQQPVVVQRRNKVVKRIWEQIELAKAQAEGKQYVPTRLRTLHDEDTGQSKTVQVPKRVKEWWWTAENGKLCLSLRYGAKVIELAKGKGAIEVGARDELLPTLAVLLDAVKAGELDQQIETVCGEGNSGFKK